MNAEPEQMDLFGSSIPLSELPALSPCTCDEGCRAEADDHMPQCPVEQNLLEDIGF
jgi:hypothetical protein